MLDLTSSLYLSERHPHEELAPWSSLTTGRPAVLGSPSRGRRAAVRLAARQGCDTAFLARSTLHALADCVAVLGGPRSTVLLDDGAYPVAGWAAAWHAGQGRALRRVAHLDPADLSTALQQVAAAGRRPLVLVDGWCPGCGRAVPLREYVHLVERRGGLVVLDDTQALGLLGARPAVAHPLGRGGGGTPAHQAVRSPALVVVASLAKALGVPAALVSGAREVVLRLDRHGPSRSSASPPTSADVAALEAAVAHDQHDGERRRRRLAGLVLRLRRRLAAVGLELVGGLLPVQTLPALRPAQAVALHRGLLQAGIRTVLQRPRCRPGACVALLLTVEHTPTDVDQVAAAVDLCWPRGAPRAVA